MDTRETIYQKACELLKERFSPLWAIDVAGTLSWDSYDGYNSKEGSWKYIQALYRPNSCYLLFALSAYQDKACWIPSWQPRGPLTVHEFTSRTWWKDENPTWVNRRTPLRLSDDYTREAQALCRALHEMEGEYEVLGQTHTLVGMPPHDYTLRQTLPATLKEWGCSVSPESVHSVAQAIWYDVYRVMLKSNPIAMLLYIPLHEDLRVEALFDQKDSLRTPFGSPEDMEAHLHYQRRYKDLFERLQRTFELKSKRNL